MYSMILVYCLTNNEITDNTCSSHENKEMPQSILGLFIGTVQHNILQYVAECYNTKMSCAIK